MKKSKEHLINLIVSNKSLAFDKICTSLFQIYQDDSSKNSINIIGISIQIYWVARQQGYSKYKDSFSGRWNKVRIENIKTKTITANYNQYLKLKNKELYSH